MYRMILAWFVCVKRLLVTKAEHYREIVATVIYIVHRTPLLPRPCVCVSYEFDIGKLGARPIQ